MGVSPFVSAREAVVGKIFNHKLTNFCKSIVVNDASQLYQYSICQNMLTGYYNVWDLKIEGQKSKAVDSEIIVFSSFQRMRLIIKTKASIYQGTEKPSQLLHC